MSMWRGARVLVTGGTGFLGKNLVPALEREGAILTVPGPEIDLTREANVERVFADARPEIVVHMAADVGGIGYLKEHPASTLANNLLLNTLVLERARTSGAKKCIAINTVNAYPATAAVPFTEDQIFSGPPDANILGYGTAKRIMLLQGKLLFEQYGFLVVNLVLENMYGPHDTFALDRARVVPATIGKCVAAAQEGATSVSAWGTGASRREYLYVEDAVRAIVILGERVTTPEPINVGTGHPVTVKELITTIAELAEFHGPVAWDSTKPDGQLARFMDVSRARTLGFTAEVSLRDGLSRTIAWYREHGRGHPAGHARPA